MRNLATIQIVVNIRPIPGADAIEVCDVLGWHVVIKKGEFKENDLCVYVEIDATLPDKPDFEFLRERKFKVKTIKLRGQISQGICFPLSILKTKKRGIGDDVTDELGVTKYEPDQYNSDGNKQKSKYVFPVWFPIFLRRFLVREMPFIARLIIKLLPRSQRTMAKTWLGVFPKTDETRVQVLKPLLDKYAGTKCYVTEKLDGSSITCYWYKGKFGVCSRNLDIDRDETNPFWRTAIQMGIEERLMVLNINVAIQGEIVGESIQGNKYKLSGKTIFFFSAFDIGNQRYYSYFQFKTLMSELGLPIVPILNENYTLIPDIDAIVNEADGESLIGNNPREGIVIRPLTDIYDFDFAKFLVSGRVSFKAVSPKFLLKYGE